MLSRVELEGERLLLCFTPRDGRPPEIEDSIELGAPGEMATVYGVGRLLRVMRAARVRLPAEPYRLPIDREHARDLLQACVGARVQLQVDRRLQRVLTLWTESGVQRVRGLVDYDETPERLTITRRGVRAAMHIPKRDLIRFETSTEDDYVIVSVETV